MQGKERILENREGIDLPDAEVNGKCRGRNQPSTVPGFCNRMFAIKKPNLHKNSDLGKYFALYRSVACGGCGGGTSTSDNNILKMPKRSSNKGFQWANRRFRLRRRFTTIPGHASVAFVWQKLAGHRDADTVAFRVFLAADLHIEVDSAHDAVTEFLLDECLPRCAVGLHELMEAVDQWVRRRNVGQGATVRRFRELNRCFLIQLEQFCGILR